MSKHHHFHQSQSAGGYQSSNSNSQKYGNQIPNEMIMMAQGQQQQSHASNQNGMRLPIPNGIAMHNGGSGSSSGDIDSNDTNNNYNKHHHNHHHNHHHSSHHSQHRDGKRSASSGSGSGSGEASSSKRTKLSSNSSNNNHGVPSNKYGSLIHNNSNHQHVHQMTYEANVGSGNNNINHNNNNSNNNNGISAQHNNLNAAAATAGHYNIMEKLKELYRELKGDKTCKELNLSPSSFLLDKLVTRERLHTLIINLYPGNKGYSLAFRVPTVTTSSTTMPKVQQQQLGTATNLERETVHETPSWLYDNVHLLDALDAEELPPLLIDFCNAHCPHLYYNGSVIAQIRDYRQSYPLDICDMHYVLLRPTAAALWDEINGTVDTSWSIKERTALESQLVLATAPPMCLDPSPQVGIAAINSTTERSPIAACDGVVRMAKKFLQVTKNRNNKLEKKTHYPQLSLANHIAIDRKQQLQHKTRDTNGTNQKCSSTVPSMPNIESNEDLSSSCSFKSLPIVPPSQRYDWQARNTERLTFETDRDNCQYRVRVELFERATTCEVSGQLTLERQKSGSQVSGRMCPFKLASPLAARRYVKEFMGIFTEEGRKFVKITHERETRAGREITEMQTGEKVTATTITTPATVPVPVTQKIQTIPIIAQPQGTQQLQTLQHLIASPPPPLSTSITSPPPPALVATTPTAALKLTATPQRIITARPSSGQVVVLAQVKQESPGNQVIKNLLNQPRAPMTQSMVNGLNIQTGQEVQTVYLQVDNSNLIHMGSAVPNLQFQQLLVPTAPVTQATPTYTMNVQTVTPQQVTVVKRHRDM